MDRAAVELLWSVTFGGERKIKQGAAWVDYTFPEGVAHVELIPETAKLDVNFVPPDRLMRAGDGAGRGTGPGLGDHERDRRPEDPGGGGGRGGAFSLAPGSSFPAAGASFQEIEELLSVRGITPEVFYGTYVPAQGEPGPGQPRLIRRSGLVECLSVFGSKGQVDANTADPAVLTALGMTPDVVQFLLRLRREAPLTQERLDQLAPMLGPAAQFLRLEGNSIITMRATARVRLANGQLSDMKRTVAAQVKYMPPGYTPPSTSCAGTTPRGATSQAMPLDFAIAKDFRKLLAFGSGVGVEIGATDLEVAVTRVRPNKVQVLGRLTIERLRHASGGRVGRGVRALPQGVGRGTPERHGPAAAARSDRAPDRAARCGREGYRGRHPLPTGYAAPLWRGRCGVGLVAARVRRRAGGHRAAQHDRTLCRSFRRGRRRGAQLHVFGGGGSRRHTLNGDGTAGRGLRGAEPHRRRAPWKSTAKARRARCSARSSTWPRSAPPRWHSPNCAWRPIPLRGRWKRCCPSRPSIRWQNDLSRNALPYATALSGACPRFAPAANVLPPEHRRFNSRAVFVPTMVLAALLLLVAGSMAAYASWSEKQYLKQINAEIARLEPLHKRADSLDKENERARARAQLLDQFRKQTRMDLDALNELTHLLEPPAWSNNIDLTRDSVRISGEAPQTAPLFKILDASPFFEKTEIQMSAPRASGETFQIPHQPAEGQMNLGTLDRKTAILWISGVAAILLLRFVVLADRSPDVVAASESVPMARSAWRRLRQIAATVPGKETF